MTDQVQCNPFKENIDHQVSQITSAKCLEGFLAAILIWINKPHVTNRRLMGTQLLSIFSDKCPETDHEIHNFFDDMNRKFGGQVEPSPSDNNNSEPVEADDHPGFISESGRTDITIDDLNTFSTSDHHLLVIVRDLLPKQLNHNLTLREVITFGRNQYLFSFFLIRIFSLSQLLL